MVKVLDFGLAKAFADGESDGRSSHLVTVTSGGTREGVIVGTPAYMSPEQARGQPIDKRTDIWAFGCVVYELLTGVAVFAGKTFSDTIAAVLEREPDWKLLPPRHRCPFNACFSGAFERIPSNACTTSPTHGSSWMMR